MRRVHSDDVFKNQSREELKQQYHSIINDFEKTEERVNPTTLCSQVEGAMYSWIGFKKYIWLEEKSVNGKFYPKVAVIKGRKNELVV